MNLEIIEKKEQKLLSRLEINAKISFSGGATPSNDDVKAEISKAVGKDAKLVVIKNIYTKYGDASADVLAYVYDDEKKLDELEKTHKKAKKKEGEEEAVPKEKPKEKAPKKEEKKEEAAKEEK